MDRCLAAAGLDAAEAELPSLILLPLPSASFERGLQPGEISGAEDKAVLCRDVHKVEVDSSLGDLSRQVGEDSRPILHRDDDHFTFTVHAELRERKRVLRRFGVRNEDVELDVICRAHAGRRGQVHAGVTDRRRHAR